MVVAAVVFAVVAAVAVFDELVIRVLAVAVVVAEIDVQHWVLAAQRVLSRVQYRASRHWTAWDPDRPKLAEFAAVAVARHCCISQSFVAATVVVVVASEYVECARAQFVPLAVSWENCWLLLTVLGLQRRSVMKYTALLVAVVLAVK